jgi:predicted membrane metal-binding protein
MLVSLPITINTNYEINILSIFNNLIFVPLVSIIIYPLSLLTLIIRPLDNVLLEYEELATPLFNMIESNQQESRRLAQLRDTLLPRLMSGEIKVGDVTL